MDQDKQKYPEWYEKESFKKEEVGILIELSMINGSIDCLERQI